MAQVYVFGDEAGTLQFNAKASRYFILVTVTATSWAVGDALLRLRRELAWGGVATHPDFHATEERQPVRDRVFAELRGHSFRVDATIFDKPKAHPSLRETEAQFYQVAWFYHLRYLAYSFDREAELLVAPAALGARPARREAFGEAVRKVVNEVATVRMARVAVWTARTEPCLWTADYCCWAIQRKWEHAGQPEPDTRSHALIRSKIRSEFNFFERGTTIYY